MHYIFQIQVYEGAHTAVGGGIDLIRLSPSHFSGPTLQREIIGQLEIPTSAKEFNSCLV